jgi:hypothetical protein
MVKSTSGSPELDRVRYNHDSDAWGHRSNKFRYALIDPTTGPKHAPSCPGRKAVSSKTSIHNSMTAHRCPVRKRILKRAFKTIRLCLQRFSG